MPRRKQEDVSLDELEKVEEQKAPSLEDTVKALMQKVDLLSNQNQLLREELQVEKEKTVQNTNIGDKPVDAETALSSAESAIIKEVDAILANKIGQFKVRVLPKDALNIHLTIFPPKHLEEFEGARWDKIIPSLGGMELLQSYVKTVKAFCISLADKRGVEKGFEV